MRNRTLNSFESAFNSIFRPFEGPAWGMVGLFATMLCLCFGLFIIVFCPHREIRPAFEWILTGERSDNPYEATTWRMLIISVTVFFAVLVLLYEVGIAVLLFRGSDPLIRNITEVKTLNLSKLTVA